MMSCQPYMLGSRQPLIWLSLCLRLLECLLLKFLERLTTLIVLWKTCLVGAGQDGKHTALEAVTIVLDLPPPQPGSMFVLTSVDMISASDPKSAMALQRSVQAAVWFLGEMQTVPHLSMHGNLQHCLVLMQ